ncbi:MAG: cyanophycin synthetase, partial [Clostridia bacterium]
NNSLAAIAICDIMQTPMSTIIAAINCFVGVSRRFECKGFSPIGARIIVDYAHHPEEVKQSIACAKSISQKRLFVVFEPHTFSRTKALFYDFVMAFDEADCVELLPTYSARETQSQGMSSKQLYDALQEKYLLVNYHNNYQSLAHYLQFVCEDGDTVLILGAGDVYKVADLLLKN